MLSHDVTRTGELRIRDSGDDLNALNSAYQDLCLARIFPSYCAAWILMAYIRPLAGLAMVYIQ